MLFFRATTVKFHTATVKFHAATRLACRLMSPRLNQNSLIACFSTDTVAVRTGAYALNFFTSLLHPSLIACFSSDTVAVQTGAYALNFLQAFCIHVVISSRGFS